MPGRPARHQYALAGDRAAQRSVDEQRGIEMALPIVPKAPSVVLEPRNGDAGGEEQFLRIPAVEPGRIVDEHEHVVR